MSELPLEFLNQMREMLGDETPAFLRAMEQPPALALRLNPLREGADAAAAPFTEAAVPWEPLGRYLKPEARPGASIAHWAGAYYVQEASAMLAVAALAPMPGERILDLCAAPGGKSTQIAAALRGEGVLVSNEPEPSRAKVLAANLERMGAANAIVVNALPDRLARLWPEVFDAILVDAPCSGEGMFRRDPAARLEWQPGSPRGCAARQAEILDRAAEMLRPGGRLVYSTCTFNRLENEGSVEGFLARHPDFAPEDFALPGVGASQSGMIRALPHRLRGDGHFAARLRKAGAGKAGGAPARPARANAEIKGYLDRLAREVCGLPDCIQRMRPELRGDRLYAIPASAPPTDGLRVLTPGLALLRAGRSHIEPEHALAMALPAGLARRAAGLDDGQAAAYLSGEALAAPGEGGWSLVTWRGLPLGWGKRTDGLLKNHLPKGLRRAIHASELT